MNDRLHSVNGYVVSCSALYYVSLLLVPVPLNGAFETVPRPHFSETYVNAPLIPVWIHLPVSFYHSDTSARSVPLSLPVLAALQMTDPNREVIIAREQDCSFFTHPRF